MANNEGPTRTRSIRTRSGRVAVRERGVVGLAVVFLEDTESWDQVLGLFPPGFRLVAVEISDRTHAAECTDTVADVIDALGLDRVVLVGRHAGATIAVEYAARCADRVAGLVLLDCRVTGRKRRLLPLVEAPAVCAVGDGESRSALNAARMAADLLPNGVVQEMSDVDERALTRDPAVVASVVYGLAAHCGGRVP